MRTRRTVLAQLCVAVAAGLTAGWSGRATSADGAIRQLTLPLYPSSITSSRAQMPATAKRSEIDERLGGLHILRNVTRPTLTAYLPDRADSTGAGAIIAPGGAFMMLSIDIEGNDVARWLAAHHIAAFVLKYRLAPTPAHDVEFAALLGKTLSGVAHRSSPYLPMLPGEEGADADALQALRLVKGHAREWGLDPNRIGFLGFSAGALMALHVAQDYDATTRPAFVGAMYGVIPFDRPLRQDEPPLFVGLAADDPFFASIAPRLYTEWRSAHVPVELHIYEKGGHGFGMRKQGTTSDHWIQELYWWLQDGGMLRP